MEQERTQPATKRARPSSPPQARAADAEDRLSALDDATLHAILARVPLRDAAVTAALSRRWPRVFATLPRLVIRPATFNRRGFPDEGDEDRCEDPRRWMDALRRVLDGRAAPVAALEIDSRFMSVHCNWFNKVFRELCCNGGLLELSIVNTDYTECYALPSTVYACTTLTSLDLYNCWLRLSGSLVGLRPLRLLRLRNVTATDAELCRLIRRGSTMEHLEIHDVHKARNIIIEAPCLKKLYIYSYRPLCIVVKKAPPLDMVKLSLSYGCPEHSWSLHDTKDIDRDYSIHEMEEMLDYKKMAEREHKQTDEIKNMVKFLCGVSSTKSLRLHLSTEYSEVVSMSKASIPKSLPKKSYLLGLKSLSLILDHNHEVLSTFVSCLLNSCPNLKDLRIIELRHPGSPAPLPAEFWFEKINGGGFLYRLSSVTFYTDSLFEGHPCGGICKFLVMNAITLKKMSIKYHHSQVKPEHAAKLEAARRELRAWPRASDHVLLELTPIDYFPSF
ncbi:putative F-box/FBD/LRR-repeat protein At1g78760 [Setaria italica]|uniref:F-box/LRR-repeat protein 15/At3g58940/PEG3-like LRR domain-containing protein n=1 Tax=Setaria italica TaxID=4555 RepID=K3YCH1_SETIT|nr:putative F-box/FBD/LRR-repeat protein At1g78760 [Setaria italica]